PHSCPLLLPPRPPHPFPTRRSSDLCEGQPPGGERLEPLRLVRRDEERVPLAKLGELPVEEGHSFGVEPCVRLVEDEQPRVMQQKDRKSTRLNSSHGSISYAVFCLKK